MSSDRTFALIERAAALRGKEKIAFLEEHRDEAMLKDVFYRCYSPFITYGIAKVPQVEKDYTPGRFEFGPSEYALLAGLADRTITGNAARESLLRALSELTFKSGTLLLRIITKDLRCGVDAKSVNKVWPGLVPVFPYMRCTLMSKIKDKEAFFKDGAYSQEKANGMFANVNLAANGVVTISSRQGSPFPVDKFGVLEVSANTTFPRSTQTHGELLVERDGVVLERQIGNGILNSVLEGGDFAPEEYPIFLAWDQIPASAVVSKGKCEVPYEERLRGLAAQIEESSEWQGSIRLIETIPVRNLAEAMAHYRQKLTEGKEGTVVKKRKAIWKDGTSNEQVKLKLEVPVDLEIVAVLPGKANTKNEGRPGSLTCQTRCGNLRVDVTIKNEDMRDRVERNPDAWIGKIAPVIANEVMLPSASNDLHSLFLPRMAEPNYRKDKDTADDLAEVFEQFEDAIMCGEAA